MKEKTGKHSTVLGKIYRYNLILVLTSVLISGMVSLYISLTIRQNDLDTVIRNLSRTVANMDSTRAVLQSKRADSPDAREWMEELDLLSESFEQVDILVVCDTESRRYYHSNHSRIGKQFQGKDQEEILKGAEPYISEAEGTLGMQRRAFYSIKDDSGEIIGFVVSSVLTSSLARIRYQIAGIFLCLLIVMIILGVIFSRAAMYGIRRILLGYQPEEFQKLYVERTEVMDALEEGIVAINQEEKVILMNTAARSILKIPEGKIIEGTVLPEIFPDAHLQETLKTGKADYNMNQMIQKQNILSSRIPIFHNKEIIGAAAVLRNKTEVTKLAEELTGARYMVDTLRAFNHEFMNKLHIILGFLEMQEVNKAKEYILKTSLVSGESVSQISRTVPISNLAALLIGKLIRASELGIQFALKSDSYFYPKITPLPVDCYITLVGNLLENAMDELNSRNYPVKEIELGIYSEDGHTMITCDDTGGGIPEEILFSIYDRNTTTKGPGHGTGFALIREIVDCYDGTIHIDTEPGMGTSIEIVLPV
ncbi:MAG: sensor histidine kinase [Eubacteriales bacterium]|nr:sensor histidine kinase [Eubacteriales bacterium]